MMSHRAFLQFRLALVSFGEEPDTWVCAPFLSATKPGAEPRASTGSACEQKFIQIALKKEKVAQT